MKKTVAVVGAGAAGLMAAGIAAQNGHQVLLFEKNNKVGRKLYITGTGRCNVTNRCDFETLMEHIPRNSRFLYSALKGFGTEDAIAFFENLGVPLKTERGGRVFPVSDKASDIIDALYRFVRKNRVQLIFDPVTELLSEQNKIHGIRTAAGEYAADCVILATGGLSYPGTGSTGDGYRFAEKLGHHITELRPSLVPLCARGNVCGSLQGLSLKNVSVKVWENGKMIHQDFGEMMFTHFGITGPLVLTASAKMRRIGESDYKITIDFKPALDEKQLDKRILSDFLEKQNSDFINALSKLLPRKLIPVVVGMSGIDGRQKVHSVTKEQRTALVKLLKAFPVEISGTAPIEQAVITAGGVDVKEISPKTMESKLMQGLYFAGEILDVDAYTGGFNLQIAWATGYRAGSSV